MSLSEQNNNVKSDLFFKVNPACAAQSLVVADLINGQDYIFRIRAENRFGFGPVVETTEGIKARDPIRTSALIFLS